MSSKSVFDEVYSASPSVFDEVYSSKKEPKLQEPATLKGSAQAFGSGFGGGVGGAVPDILKLIEPFSSVSPTIGATTELAKLAGLKGTHDLTAQFASQDPQNALERILQQSGQFGGQEALVGTAIGGPVGGAVGTAHGAASGALYGGLKEAGVPDEWALGLTALTTLSPIAAQKLWPKLVSKFKSGASFQEAAKEVLPKGLEMPGGKAPARGVFEGPNLSGEPPPPPGAPPAPGKFEPGSILPETKGTFGEKENIIKDLHKVEIPPKLGIEAKLADTTAEAPSLQGRVSEAQDLGQVISKEPFETEAQSGRSIAREVTNERNAARDVVREKYKAAEEVTSTHNAPYAKLAHQNEERIHRLEQLEKRSAGEEAVYQDALALRRIIGEPHGLIETNADRLMKQANSFSQKVKYELPYAGYKGEIKSVVHEMNQAVIESLENSGKNAAAVKEADRTFARFADRFMGDEISPYFQKKILNPEELGKKAISDPSTYRAVKRAIGERGSPLVNKIDREVVHNVMDKYFKDPLKVNSKEYVKDLKNLSEKIGKEKTAEVDHFLRQKQLDTERKIIGERKIKESDLSKQAIKGREPQKPKPIETKKPIAKTPEELDKLFKSRSDIRRLRREMKDKGLSKEFDKQAEQKVEEILKEGGFGAKKVTGSDLKRIIDKEHAILSELLGEEEVSLLYKVASKAGNEELTVEVIKQVAKAAGRITANLLGIGKLMKLIPLNRI